MKDCTPTRKFVRLIALLLTLATLIVSLPLTVFAMQTEREQPVLAPSDVPEQLNYEELQEQGYVERLYDEEHDLYSYLFGKEDGSKTQIYYQYPVKYIDENGEIRDKSLKIESETVNGVERFVSQDHDISVTFHNNLASGIELAYQDLSLTMIPEATTFAIPQVNADLSDDNKSVRYILDEDTYIDYSLTYMGVKEDIVVNEYTGRTSYAFLLTTGGLSAVMNETGEYVLTDDDGTIRAYLGDVLIFTADERNNTFGEMIVEPVLDDQLYRLTIQVDAEWLADEETTYPITIDPTISVTVDDTTYGSIEDCSIGSGATYGFNIGSIYVGRNNSSHTIRSLMRFPNLDLDGKIITAASVEIRDLLCEAESDLIECHEYIGNSWSSAVPPTWSNVGTDIVGDLLDSHYVCYGNGNVESDINRYRFDITTLAKDWAAGKSDPAKGIVFKATDSFENGTTNTFRTFASIDRAEQQPSLSITYSDAVGLNSSYEYDTQALGENISFYNNIQYGELLAEYVFSIPEGLFPIQPSYVYNSALSSVEFFDNYGMASATYGKFTPGWKLNLVELIKKQGSGYLYVDGYCTEYYLTYDADKEQYVLDEIGATLAVNSDGSFVLKTDDDISRVFSANGLVTSLTYDKKTYVYQYTNNKLTGITCNGDTVLSITYSSDFFNTIGYISAVDGSKVAYTVPYSSGSMSKILDVYGNTTNISSLSNSFDIWNGLDGYGYHYTLSSGKVTGYYSYRVTGSAYTLSSTSISRTDNRICYTTDDLMTTYLLDAYGRVFNVVVSSTDGKTVYDAQMYSYAEDDDKAPASVVGGGSINLLSSTFESFTSGWTGNFTQSTDKALLGKRSAKLTSTDGSKNFMSQTVSLTAGSYVLSAYVQYSDLQKKTAGTAGGFNFGITDSSGNRISTGEYYLDSLTDTEDEWVRVWIPCTVTASGSYTVTFALDNAVGTVYLDCFQMEQGTTPSTYNCLKNAGFEQTGTWMYDSTPPQSNLMFGNYVGEGRAYEYQSVYLNGMPNSRKLIVSGWVYVEEGSGSDCALCVRVVGTSWIIEVPFEDGEGLQYIAYEITIPSSIPTLDTIEFLYNCESSTTAYFDNVLLSFGSPVEEEETEETYSSGLNYVSNGDGTCYVYNIGTCTDTDIVIPPTSPDGEKVIRIGSNAFVNETEITSVTLPDTLEIIRFYAFSGCTSLKSVNMGNNVKQVEYRAFSGCTALEDVQIPDTLTSIGEYCFTECSSLKSITIPDSVTELGGACFYLCTGLESVTLSDSLSIINYSTFNGCSSLESIVLPETVTQINNYAFLDCTKLQSIQIPEVLTTVQNGVFYNTASNITFYCTGASSVWSNITFGTNALPTSYKTQFNSELMGNFVYTYTYDSKGNIVGTEIHYIGYAEDAANSDAVMFTSVVYDAQGNLLSYTDESGHTTTYTYDRYGNVLTVTDASGVTTTYTYYSNGLLKSVSRGGQTNTYTYTNGLLTGVTHTGTNYSQSYTYTYNNYGNLVTVKVGSQTLVTYAYEDGGKGDLLSITYANGDVKSYAYDIFGNTTEVRMNNALQASYLYDYNGSLYAHTETVTGETARYFEDEYGYAGYTLTFASNGQQVAAIAEPSVELGSTTTEDIYDRLVSKALTAGDATVFTQNYTYASNDYYSSYEIAGESFSGGSAFAYTYNDLGYLTSVKENGTLKLSYTYDNLGQLTREDNAYAGKTYVYTYDNGGNILTKKTYAYTTGTVGTVQSTVNYGYGNSNWKDQLTSYNGTSITYDASGNPLNWRNASAMNWTGRQLDSMTLTDGTNVSFQYNSDGLRVSKTVGSDTVKYRWDGATLVAEVHNDYTITFLYDGDILIGFNYGGDNYYYGIDNLGVIHYVYNEAGTVVVTYTYDAWGNTISASGNSSLININPFRYKSYYYDGEMGFFYLQSRYYDAVVGRFVNADDTNYLGATGTVLSYNLYSYCENDPINDNDPTGNGPFLAIGVQFAIQIGRFTVGLEALWSTSNWKFYLFGFIGGAKNLNVNLIKQTEGALLEDVMYLLKSVPKFKISDFKIFKKLSISVSFIAVLGNKRVSFPKDYCGWFTGISLAFMNVTASGAWSKSGKKVIGSLGVGVTTSKGDMTFAQTYYIQLTGNSALKNNLNQLVSGIKSKLNWLKLFSCFF